MYRLPKFELILYEELAMELFLKLFFLSYKASAKQKIAKQTNKNPKNTNL